jgi:hypothetical protein
MVVRASAVRGLFIAVSVVGGCQLVVGLQDELTLAGEGGGSSGAGAAGGGPPEACRHEAVTPPPAVTNAGGTEEFVVAMRSIRLDDPTNGVMPGLNLDGLCTCDGEGPSCEAADPNTPKGPCDIAGGRDVSSRLIFNGVAYLLLEPEVSTLYTSFAEAGAWSVLLRVRGYNGADDDDEVELAWFESPGLGAAPSWNGSDVWPVALSSIAGASVEEPRYFDPKAYVTGGKLVASLSGASMVIAGSGTFLRMQPVKLLLEARIEPTGGGYVLRDGVIGAWLPVSEVFAMMSSFRDTEGLPFCTDANLYAATKELVCTAADVPLGVPSKDVPCDAISFGAGFEAHPAALGPIAAPPSPSQGCPEVTNPANDGCML